MNRERIKSLILTGLVLMSIMLTIQLWLDVPIGRIASVSELPERQDSKKNYNLSDFVLPRWITVNFGGQSHTMLLRNSGGYKYYREILRASIDIFKHFAEDGQQGVLKQAGIEEWTIAKSAKSVELNFERPLSAALVQKAFFPEAGLDLSLLNSIKSLVVTVGTEASILIKDDVQGQIYKILLPHSGDRLIKLIDELEEIDPVKYWTFQEIGFSENSSVYLPLEMRSINLPIGIAEQEIDASEEQTILMYASSFFKDMSIVRKITETSGSVIFTDGSSALKVYTNGYVEYLIYNVSTSDIQLNDIGEALNAALNYIDNHGGIPEQLILREVETVSDNQRRGFLFRFNYCSDGLPFVYAGSQDFSPIEVSVINNSVVGYKRLVHHIKRFTIVKETLLNPIEALNVMLMKDSSNEAQSWSDIQDMYLGYFIDAVNGKDYQAIPVWYIKKSHTMYIIDAYKGIILN